jgi:hypothetical protein
MSRLVSFIALGSSLVYFGLGIPSSLAQTTSSTQTVMVKPYILKVPMMKPEQMKALEKIMHSDRDSCFLQDLDPGDDSSMILVCGIDPQPTVTFTP